MPVPKGTWSLTQALAKIGRPNGQNLAEIEGFYGVTNATAGIQTFGHHALTLRA